MALRIDSSGILLLQQAGSNVQYKSYTGTSWTDISAGQWPVTLNNTDTANTLQVTFTTDLSFNSLNQYFIIDSSNITIDGSDNVVNVNVSAGDYPGLIQNGTRRTNGKSNITIQNLGVESTYAVAGNGGWVGQQYFGKNATNNSVTNCYSTGTIGSNAGGILGQYSQGSATNCYSTGTIVVGAGGIFGQYSQASASATNCYSTGTIGTNAGGIFGYNSRGTASNCYSTGTIGFQAGGIFGCKSQGSATNCYSSGIYSTNNGEGIGGFGTKTYCYYTDGSANWLDSAADASLNPLSAWTDIDENSETVPYRLTSFYLNQILYDPSSGINVNPEYPSIANPTDYTWSITSVNGSTTDSSGITIDVSNGYISFPTFPYNSYAVNVLAVKQFGKYSFETFTNLISNICFPADTPIVTNQGIIAINKINPAIHTIRNKKIVAITKTVSPDKYLVCFEKDALGPNVPCEATTMTKTHTLFFNGKMLPAEMFLKTHRKKVHKVPYTGFVLYNVLLEEHDKMVVNNLICETLHPENYVAKIYKVFNLLTPKQRVEVVKMVNDYATQKDLFSTFKKPTVLR